MLLHDAPALLPSAAAGRPAPRRRAGLAARAEIAANERQQEGPAAARAPARPGAEPQLRLTSASGGEGARPHTVYSVRFSTGFGRRAGLEDPYSAVQVCLVGRDGAAFLKRIPPLYDPEEVQQSVLEYSQIADKEARADVKSMKAAASRNVHDPAVKCKARFQQGSVDEVSFLGPELGPLASLLIAPESGAWVVDEVTVTSSRGRHTDRFVCQEALGTKRQPAARLTPVPDSCVVYGSGEHALILSKAQAQRLHAEGLQDYGALKQRLMGTTAALVATGSGIAYSAAGTWAAGPFLAGGMGSLLYHYALQAGVDALPLGTQPQGAGLGPLGTARRVLGSSSFRLAAVLALLLTAVSSMQVEEAQVANATQVKQLLLGLMGFVLPAKLAFVQPYLAAATRFRPSGEGPK